MVQADLLVFVSWFKILSNVSFIIPGVIVAFPPEQDPDESDDVAASVGRGNNSEAVLFK